MGRYPSVQRTIQTTYYSVDEELANNAVFTPPARAWVMTAELEGVGGAQEFELNRTITLAINSNLVGPFYRGFTGSIMCDGVVNFKNSTGDVNTLHLRGLKLE